MENLKIYYTNTSVTSDEILKDLLGKDFIKNEQYSFKDKYYSVTHCDDHLLVALSNSPLGIDLEKIGVRRERIEKEIFHSNERKLIKDGKDFTKIWTLKEAYGKLLGIGIQKRLHSIDLSKGIDHNEFMKEGYYFIVMEYLDYLCSLVTIAKTEGISFIKWKN